jgi:hypothetical protein
VRAARRELQTSFFYKKIEPGDALLLADDFGYVQGIHYFVRELPLLQPLKSIVMKREYFIVSGFGACIAASILYFAQGPADGRHFTLNLLIPSLLTFVPMLGALAEGAGHKSKLPSILPVGVRLLLFFFQLLLILFQFLVFVAWMIACTDQPDMIEIHLWGYFFLIGLICSIVMMYRLVAPRQAASI